MPDNPYGQNVPYWNQGSNRRIDFTERRLQRHNEYQMFDNKVRQFKDEYTKPEYKMGIVHRILSQQYTTEFDTSESGVLQLNLVCQLDWRDKWQEIIRNRFKDDDEYWILQCPKIVFILKRSVTNPVSPPHQWQVVE